MRVVRRRQAVSTSILEVSWVWCMLSSSRFRRPEACVRRGFGQRRGSARLPALVGRTWQPLRIHPAKQKRNGVADFHSYFHAICARHDVSSVAVLVTVRCWTHQSRVDAFCRGRCARCFFSSPVFGHTGLPTVNAVSAREEVVQPQCVSSLIRRESLSKACPAKQKRSTGQSAPCVSAPYCAHAGDDPPTLRWSVSFDVLFGLRCATGWCCFPCDGDGTKHESHVGTQQL